MRFRKKKKEKIDEQKKEVNPWEAVKPSKTRSDANFLSYIKNVLGSIGHKFFSPFGELSGRKIHVRALRKTKRGFATILFFFYGLLTLVSFPSLMFPIFLGTAFLMLDYIWKTRKAVNWIKVDEK